MVPPAGLTVQQERDLVIAAEAGDSDACRRLVEAFLPNINRVAWRFRNSTGVDRRDLVQEGVAGLLFAARRFDVRLATPFWAYASFWVRKGMQELVADLDRALALSDRAVRDLATVRTARREYYSALGSEPTVAELAALTGQSQEHVEQLLAADRIPRSLEARIDPDDDSAGTLADRLDDPGAVEAFDVVLEDIELRRVRILTEELSDREQAVLRAHFGLGEPIRTLAEIGQDLGVSAERTRQIEAAALGKLRALLAEPALPSGST